MDILIIS